MKHDIPALDGFSGVRTAAMGWRTNRLLEDGPTVLVQRHDAQTADVEQTLHVLRHYVSVQCSGSQVTTCQRGYGLN